MATRSEVEGFTVEELCDFLSRKLCDVVEDPEDVIDEVRKNKISGKAFLDLSDEDLRELIQPIGDRKALKALVATYRPQASVVSQPTYESTRPSSSGWAASFKIPKFSRSTEEAITKGKVTKGIRTEVITSIAFEVWNFTQYPTSAEYNAVCQKLVSHHPTLKDTVGNGHGSWKIQLRQRLSNMRRPMAGEKRGREEGDKENQPVQQPPKKKSSHARAGSSVDVSGNDDESVSYEENMQKLQTELAESKPSRKVVRRLMKATFMQRRAWILNEDANVSAVLEAFPCLKKSKYIRRELEAIVENVDLSKAKKTWTDYEGKIEAQAALEALSQSRLQALKLEFEEAQAATDEDLRLEMLRGVYCLEALTVLMARRAKAKVIFKFSMTCNLDEEVKKKPHNYPYIAMVVGDSSLQFFQIAERIVVAESEGFIDALIDLICVYFTYNIEYPRPLYAVLLFIQHYIIEIKDNQRPPAALISTLSSLQK